LAKAPLLITLQTKKNAEPNEWSLLKLKPLMHLVYSKFIMIYDKFMYNTDDDVMHSLK